MIDSITMNQDIRKYKEKLLFGLTLRQLICTSLALGICVPLYIFGSKYLGEDLTGWLIMLVAVPIAGIGFIRVHGMTFEIFMKEIFNFMIRYPKQRKFQNNNFYSELNEKAKKSEYENISINKIKKYNEQVGLESAFLLEMAEMKGEELELDKIKDLLLTVSTPKSPKKNNKKKNDKENENLDEQEELSTEELEAVKLGKKSKLQISAEKIEEKRNADPTYVLSTLEGKIVKMYAEEVRKKRVEEFNKAKKGIQKKSSKLQKRRKAKSFIPKSTQDTIPYIADYDEGLFEVEPNVYSKTFELQDINFLVVRDEEQENIFWKWMEFLNYFGEDVTFSLCVDNRVISLNEQEEKIFYKTKGDKLDIHRQEYNKILRRQIIAGKNDIQHTIAITVSINCNNAYEAILKFHRIEQEIINKVKGVGSRARVLTTEERLARMHDLFRSGREGNFDRLLKEFEERGENFFEFLKKKGLSSKDYIAPSSFFFKEKDFFLIEDKYCRCMYLNNYPASLPINVLNELTDVDFPLMTTLQVQPIAKDKGLRLVKKQLTGMEKDKIEAEQRALKAGYSTETINHDLRQSINQAEILLDDCVNHNQKLFLTTICFMVQGNSLEELEENCKVLTDNARQFTCQIQTFDFQQENAFKVVLPLGVRPTGKLFVENCFTTKNTAVFIPFASQEIFQEGGYYYGLNQISLNLILCNRTAMKTPSGFVLGSSGSGKSFATKREMLNVLLSDDKTNVLVIDPENEYGDFCKAFGGIVFTLSTSNDDIFINPMDMTENYGLDDKDDPNTISMEVKKDKALKKKSSYLMGIVQCMLTDERGVSAITPQQKSILDKIIKKTYAEFLDHDFDMKYIPTLLDLQEEADKVKDHSEDARLLADGMEYYTRGSMNLFAHKTNVDFSNRLVVFNIRDLGTELKQISLLIVLDFIWNRMLVNANLKIRTYCYVDEIHVLFKNIFSAQYLNQLYKRGRKYGMVITGITQDCEDILRTELARTMISNSKFIMMLEQSSENLSILAKMLKISDAQMQYVTNSDEGTGLLFAENTIVPFVDRFPQTSYLYKLMSTKFGEAKEEDIEKFIEDLRRNQETWEKAEADRLDKNIA